MLPRLVHTFRLQEGLWLFDDRKKILRLDIECRSDADDGEQLRIGFAVLDDREVGDFHVDDGGQICLGHFECLPTGSDGPSQSFEKCRIIVHPFFHERNFLDLCHKIAMDIHKCKRLLLE